MHCHAGVSLSCCAVPWALNYFLSLTGRETQLVPSVCRRKMLKTKGTESIKSRVKEAWFPLDLYLASWADSDSSCSLPLPLLTAPPASLLPFVLALAFVCVCQPNNPCSRSEILVTAQAGRAKVQVACKTHSRLRASPRAMAWTASNKLQLPERQGSGSLLPSRWVLHTYTPLLEPLKSSHWKTICGEQSTAGRQWVLGKKN